MSVCKDVVRDVVQDVVQDVVGAYTYPDGTPQFYHCFDRATLGPFDHDRDSNATGADHEGIIRTVGTNVPVFPGARVVENFASRVDGPGWTYNGSTVSGDTLTPSGNVGDRALFTVPGAAGQPYVVSMKLSIPGAAATNVRVRLLSMPSSTGVNYERLINPGETVHIAHTYEIQAGDTQMQVLLYPDRGDGTKAATFADIMFEQTEAAPASYIEQGTQHFTTTNGNTVDGNGVVTEAPGTALTTIEGLQLEGGRTGALWHSTDISNAAWTKSGLDAPAVGGNGPFGIATTRLIPSTSNVAAWTGFSTPVTSGVTVSFTVIAKSAGNSWLQIAGSTGFDSALFQNINLDTLEVGNGNWPTPISAEIDSLGYTHVTLAATPNATNSSGRCVFGVYSTDVSSRLPGIIGNGVDGIDFAYINQEVGVFPSSQIVTSGAQYVRAATLCQAPFTAIPELPDAGLVNDFCGQVVVDYRGTFAAAEGPLRFIEIRDAAEGPDNRTYVCKSGSSDDTVVMVCIKDAVAVVTNLGSLQPGILDIRFRCSGDAFSLWVNGTQVDGTVAGDFASALSNIRLNDRIASADVNFGIYKCVRIVPEALSDEEIEAWEPAPPEFTHDFTTAEMGVFEAGFERGSDATGADHEGIIRTVGTNVPVFPGARVVENLAFEMVDWAFAGTITDLGNGEVQVTGLSGVDGDALRNNVDVGKNVEGRTYRVAIELRGEGSEIGKTVRLRVKRASGGDTVSVNFDVTLQADWVRFSPPEFTGVVDNTGVSFRLLEGSSNGTTSCFARSPQIEEVTGASSFLPNDRVDPLTTQHFATTNANTVNPTTGVVTENPGSPISGIQGVQLEGQRTNINDESDPVVWFGTNTDVEYHQTIAAPDGTFTSAHITDLGGGFHNRAITGVETSYKSIWARTVSGTGTLTMLNHNTQSPLFNLTEEWQRFTLDANSSGSGSTSFYAADFRGSGTLSEVLVWGAQADDVSDFSSSFIPTSGTGATRAATVCPAPFSAIEALPDAGFTNNFCGQVVLEGYGDLVDLMSDFARFIEISDGTTNNRLTFYVDGSTPNRIRARVARGGANEDILCDVTPIFAGGHIDLRWRLSSTTGFAVWVNGVLFSDAMNDADIPSAINMVHLATNVNGTAPNFGIYKFVRIVPRALSDADIEAWVPKASSFDPSFSLAYGIGY